jgi:hypothetical protein
MIGRPATATFIAQGIFLGYQYSVESKLKREGSLQEPLEQTIANIPKAAQQK